MNRKRLGWAGCLGLLLAAGSNCVIGAGLEISLDRAELNTLLRTAAPYQITVKTMLFTEVLTFSNLRDLVLEEGKLRIRATCTGRPAPIRAEIQAEISLVRDPESGKLEGVFSSLPVRIPPIGTIDLKDYMPRLEIPALILQAIDFPDRSRRMEIQVRDFRIRPAGIQASFDLRFLPDPPGPAPPPGTP